MHIAYVPVKSVFYAVLNAKRAGMRVVEWTV